MLQYAETKELLEATYAIRGPKHPDAPILRSMISSCLYAIERMSTSQYPGARRPIQRRSYTQREILTDPLMMSRYDYGRLFNAKSQAPVKLPPEKLQQLWEALEKLTKRERECYELIYGDNFSFSEAAEILGVAKSTVSVLVMRAKKKLGLMA